MHTWITCTKCGKVQEVVVSGQTPKGWREDADKIWCPECTDANEDEATGDILDEEIIYPSSSSREFDTSDEDVDGFCTVCKGPCQGH
jgi:hypothetical protein